MARVVNEKEYAARRNEILDVAQRLIYTQGYEKMSIQDILGELQMSKGAFYHYFDSKPALMEALTERMINEAQLVISPIADDPHLTAIEKFELYFNATARWKMAQKEFLMALLRVWYHDDNLVIRDKVTRSGMELILPLFKRIIHQGIAEGTFITPYPDQMAEVVMSLMLTLGDSLSIQILKSGTILDAQQREDLINTINKLAAAYTDALERILGCVTGSLNIIELDTLKSWLITPSETG